MRIHFSWQQAVLADESLSSGAKYILLVVGTYMNAHGAGAWPSMATIATQASVSRRSVCRFLAEAENSGWLCVTRRTKQNGEADTNSYGIAFPERVIHRLGSDTQSPPSDTQSLGWCHSVTQTPQLTPHRRKDSMSDKSDDADSRQVLQHLNQKTGARFRDIDTNLRLIRERLKTGVSVESMCRVIDYKAHEWQETDMAKYLRPSTLFRAQNFEQYLGQLELPDEKPLESKKPQGGLPWYSTEQGIKSKAAELGMTIRAGESWTDLKGRINAEIERRQQRGE